jgi:uncharacterized protein YdcH (DUF465 family)
VACLTVGQLIRKLKKMPAKSLVVFQDHDQQEDEINAYVGSVVEATPALLAKEKEKQLVVLRW